MSELTKSFSFKQENFLNEIKSNLIDLNDLNESNNIFNLINQLNQHKIGVSANDDEAINESSQDSYSETIEPLLIHDNQEPSPQIEMTKNNSIINQNQQCDAYDDSSSENSSVKQKNSISKIPRFKSLVSRRQVPPDQTSLIYPINNLLSSSSNSIVSYDSQTQSQLEVNPNENITNNKRSSRFSKSAAFQNQTKTQFKTDKTAHSKRGISLSTSSTLNKAIRSMSVNESDTEVFNQLNENSTKTVKYIVNYKPKESKVNIFLNVGYSSKIELKNVTSKIGSLEKANYVPGGGNVNIETKPLNWEAKAKIGSLEKASYTPSGGNVKIQHHQLNWQAKSKIGSLKYANYKPQGGNVKIESYKLDFKEKARPKTDTGLIVIEDVFLDKSQTSLSDHLSRSQLSFSESY